MYCFQILCTCVRCAKYSFFSSRKSKSSKLLKIFHSRFSIIISDIYYSFTVTFQVSYDISSTCVYKKHYGDIESWFTFNSNICFQMLVPSSFLALVLTLTFWPVCCPQPEESNSSTELNNDKIQKNQESIAFKNLFKYWSLEYFEIACCNSLCQDFKILSITRMQSTYQQLPLFIQIPFQ